jgi:hypothetical protein
MIRHLVGTAGALFLTISKTYEVVRGYDRGWLDYTLAVVLWACVFVLLYQTRKKYQARKTRSN